jgi:hypothetical protein
MTYTLHHADILEWGNAYDGPLFHAAFCDAPYEMREIDGAELAAVLAGQVSPAGGKGFMGKSWDGNGVSFWVQTWQAIARCLHPGAFLFVFGGTINDDLISIAMRQAGLRKHHKMLSWSYGSGLQKSTRMDDKLDRRAGAERKVIRTRKHAPKFAAADFGYREKDNGYNSRERETFDETAPATEMAQTWAGHRYGLQHLKPSAEPLLVFQKPYAGDALDSITATGAGAINIDQARIRMNPGDQKGEFGPHRPEHLGQETTDGVYGRGFQRADADNAVGRWPANFALTHHPACNGACHPDCAVRRLGEQSGVSSSRPDRTPPTAPNQIYGHISPHKRRAAADYREEDEGTAARFFYNADWLYERLEAADQIGYFAKPSQAEKEAGLDPMHVALLELLTGETHGEFNGAAVGDGRKTPIDNPFQRGKKVRRNTHTTLKAISLTRWLATLLLPPDAYAPRRLLVPFAGVGSEMIGAMLAGWEEIEGVELEAEHVRIGRPRLAYWQARRHEFLDGRPITADKAPEVSEGQLSLFDAA